MTDWRWFGGKELYRVGLTASEREQELRKFRALLPTVLRTIPIGLALVWLTWQLLLSWDGVIGEHLHIIWFSALLGPAMWLAYYGATRFSKYEVIFRENRLVRMSIERVSFRWQVIERAELRKFPDGSGGTLLVSTPFRKEESIFLPTESNWMVIEKILREKLGDRFTCTVE